MKHQRKTKVAIYKNLPTGGASEKAKSNIDYFISHCKLNIYSDRNIKPRGFLHYLFITTFILPIAHFKLAREISKNNDILISYHSWLTKSPMLLAFVKIPSIYICEEGLREYYDQKNITLQTPKERVVNLLRSFIKVCDFLIVRYFVDQIIVNSKFSKRNIDAVYRANSKIIYPGINIYPYIKK